MLSRRSSCHETEEKLRHGLVTLREETHGHAAVFHRPSPFRWSLLSSNQPLKFDKSASHRHLMRELERRPPRPSCPRIHAQQSTALLGNNGRDARNPRTTDADRRALRSSNRECCFRVKQTLDSHVVRINAPAHRVSAPALAPGSSPLPCR